MKFASALTSASLCRFLIFLVFSINCTNLFASPTVLTKICNINNVCPTSVQNFEFEGVLYDISFFTNFSGKFPVSSDYPLFWGNPGLAANAAHSLASVLESAGAEIFEIDGWIAKETLQNPLGCVLDVSRA